MIEIKVPALPESVADATISKWYKKNGDNVEDGENLVDLETDKIMLEVCASASGVIKEILVSEGGVVKSGELLAVLSSAKPQNTNDLKDSNDLSNLRSYHEQNASVNEVQFEHVSPSLRRLASELGVDCSLVVGSGTNGKITKQDIENFAKKGAINTIKNGLKQQEVRAYNDTLSTAHTHDKQLSDNQTSESLESHSSHACCKESLANRGERREKMSRLRMKIAERLVNVQQQAAILTTFNEIDMHSAIETRKKYKERFLKETGAKLGFMSFFVRAATVALCKFKKVNASLDEDELVYHDYCDVGVAIGSERGLVVPVLRNAELMSMADIEKKIVFYSERAKACKLEIDDLSGGTFTITNGGTFGSMLSTPIINPPQTAILGMHNIVERAHVVDGVVQVRPIMYVALSYDHRVIDGKDAVLFLKSIKEYIEDPVTLIFGI